MFFRFMRDRRAWKQAKHIHAYEHETKTPRSLPCDAVGHIYYEFLSGSATDDYLEIFDADQRRKFCFAAGRPW